MTEFSAHFRTLAAEFTRRVETVPTEAWEQPSPCDGWTARDVLRHVIETHQNMAGYVELSLGLDISVDEDPAGAWRQARDAMQDVLDDPVRAGREYDGYFGRTSLERTVGRFLCFDLLIHAWDIARATGQDETLPAEEVRWAFETTKGFGDNLRRNGVCGPEVGVPATAPEQDRLIGFLGRVP
jgi:uncharacterized protein (TIGR03086 family)